jgi:hypothetical protein
MREWRGIKMSMTNVRPIYYITSPKNNIKLDGIKIMNLREKFDDFDFSSTEFGFTLKFKYLNIIISKRGQIQLSLISAGVLSRNLNLLSNMAKKINFVLDIEDYSKEIMI